MKKSAQILVRLGAIGETLKRMLGVDVSRARMAPALQKVRVLPNPRRPVGYRKH